MKTAKRLQDKNSLRENFFVDKNALLDRVKELYNLKGNKELSDFLGVSKSTVSNWYARNSVDYDIIFSKCKHSDIEYLLSGIVTASDNSKYERLKDDQEKMLLEVDNELNLYSRYYDKYKEFALVEDAYIDIDYIYSIVNHYLPYSYIADIYSLFREDRITGSEFIEQLKKAKGMHRKLKGLLQAYSSELRALGSELLDFDKEYDKAFYFHILDEIEE